MSIIETAFQKRQRAMADDAGVAVRSPPIMRRTAVETVDRTAVEPAHIKTVALDSATLKRHNILLQVSDQAALRAYKILRTRVLHRMNANGWGSLAVTGTEAGAGKTMTAINLSIALAQETHTSVVLIDLDLQRPQVGGYLGMKYDKGLNDYLLGEADVSDIIYRVGVDRLCVIPNRQGLGHASELLSTPRMLELLNKLHTEMPKSVLLFDMPPLMLSDDVLSFAPQVDGVLLVVSEGHTHRSAVEKAAEVLSEMNVVGVVLNRSNERNDAQYY
ncbi:MAG: CpsD/CapB family tyrosine-protein kinase [Steroidobacteraceae bacterium]